MTARPASRISSICSIGTPAAFEISSSVGWRAQLGGELALDARDLALALADVDRDADRAALLAMPRWIAWRIQKVA